MYSHLAIKYTSKVGWSRLDHVSSYSLDGTALYGVVFTSSPLTQPMLSLLTAISGAWIV